jgi:capsular polysaccharide transport system permease protein
MSTRPLTPASGVSFGRALAAQLRVIGALLMRELHTRYGRENIGYLWLIGEPLMLATVIGSLHTTGHTEYGSDMKPLPFAVLGYTTYIMFRGIVNRSEGGLESNAPLLYHRMVTVFDIIMARAVLEAAGTTLALGVLMVLIVNVGLADWPVRPLYLFAALGLMFWYAWAHSLIITGISHENRTVGRLVHPYTYFMIPASGAFYQVEWLPHPWREWLLWLPLPHIFELARYGQFGSANLDYFSAQYLVGSCMVLTWVGLVLIKLTRSRVHLA